MAELADFMPPLDISTDELKKWGSLWLGESNPETGKDKRPERFDRHQSVNFARSYAVQDPKGFRSQFQANI